MPNIYLDLTIFSLTWIPMQQTEKIGNNINYWSDDKICNNIKYWFDDKICNNIKYWFDNSIYSSLVVSNHRYTKRVSIL